MMIQRDVLYIGLGSYVAAIQASTGTQLWRTKLGMGGGYTTISLRPEGLFAGRSGHLYSLDPATGEIRWHNRLDGMGQSIISFGDSQSGTMMKAAADAAAAS
jgi:outer membrane protein assembly factor BamB